VGVDQQGGSGGTLPGGVVWQRLQADIMGEDLPKKLAAIRPHFHVVLSDMAPKTSGNKWLDQQMVLRLARQALEIAEQLLYAGGNFYCKVFQGEDVDDFVDRVGRDFATVKTVKPKSSRSESREMFVLGMGFRGVQ
jgi:23S rRNA (uridine2552-2'-O)-methyltransferase